MPAMWLNSHHFVTRGSACSLATNKVARMRPENTLISSFESTTSHSFLVEGIRILTARGELLVLSELLGAFAWARKARMYPRLWSR